MTVELGLGGTSSVRRTLYWVRPRRHASASRKILVVPSRYDEPFGVVALEGIASGCVVVGSNRGGVTRSDRPLWRDFREWRC